MVDIIIPSQHYKSNRNISYTLKIIKNFSKRKNKATMMNSLYNAAASVKAGSMFKTAEFKNILNEATSNENWNIANSKL